MFKYRFLLGLIGVAFWGTPAAAQFETLLLTGETRNFPQGDEVFVGFVDHHKAISTNGRVAVVGVSLSLAENIRRETVWLRDLDKHWSIVAGSGITSFDIDAEETRVRINNHGELLFQEALFDGVDGVVVGTPNNFTTLGVEHTALPDGSFPGPMDALSLNDTGQVVMYVSGTSGAAGGLWFGSASQPIQRLPTTGANGEPISHSSFLLQDSQNNIFVSAISGDQSGIYRIDGQTRLAHSFATFETAPGVSEEVDLYVDDLVLDVQGNFAFSARLLRENGVTSDTESGIWKNNPDGSVSLVAREGDLAPDGTQFGEFGQSFVLNDNRLFFSSFIRVIDHGIVGRRYWSTDESGELTESFSLQRGDRAPDDAGVITSFREHGTFSESGRTAFIAEIDGDPFNQRLYYQNEIGDFETIAFSGQEIEVMPGEFRTVSGIGESLSFQGDQMVITLGFTDGSSGLFKTMLSPLGDLTSNGFVDFEDLTVLLANWNKPGTTRAEGNLVNAATTPVNFEDLTVLLADWTGPGPAGSPEAALDTEAVPRAIDVAARPARHARLELPPATETKGCLTTASRI